MPRVNYRERRAVWEGKLKKTSTGLTKKDLAISRSSGKVVSKKKQMAGRRLDRIFPTKLTRAAPFHGTARW